VLHPYCNDPAGDRLRTDIREVRMRKVSGGDDQADVLWTREGTYQGVHYVFDRAGDMVRKASPGGGDASDLELIWDANHRLAESRRDGKSTYYGYDPLGRRVFKRNPTETTWFFWDGDALLGEVKQANDAEDAAPVWVDNVASLIEVKRRQRRLEKLHGGVREYVYYPRSFVPLALIESPGMPAANTESRPVVDLRPSAHSGPGSKLPPEDSYQQVTIVVALSDQQSKSVSAKTAKRTIQIRAALDAEMGTLGSVSLGEENSKPNSVADPEAIATGQSAAVVSTLGSGQMVLGSLGAGAGVPEPPNG
jgi:YD repeat-containing protein